MRNSNHPYQGFEAGPIRPPSEAYSLLLRVNRGCGWNKCRFCGFYRDIKFSIRPAEDIKRDIDQVKAWIDVFEGRRSAQQPQNESEQEACYMAYHWFQHGMQTVFLQDANGIMTKPEILLEVLTYLRQVFPQITRITSYARSDTIARLEEDTLRRFAQLGLNRFHIGMETGNDDLLKMVNKGVTKKEQILAGRKAMAAGIEVNEFYMPGLGGREYAQVSALDTADVMNQVNPDYIRIRSMALAEQLEVYEDYRSGRLTRPNDIDTILEIRTFLEHLEGVTSVVDSDHILNILLELRGKLPEDKDKMLAVIDRFLALPQEKQMIFRLGRRLGLLGELRDLDNEILTEKVRQTMERSGVNAGNIDMITDCLMIQAIPI